MPIVKRFAPYEIGGKSWGQELVVAHTEKYLAKVLSMRAGASGPLQYHEKKEETFFLLSGRAKVRYKDEAGQLLTVWMEPGEAYHVPPGAVHQVFAEDDCVFIEGSTPVFDDRVPVMA